jgi:hypothetical protein
MATTASQPAPPPPPPQQVVADKDEAQGLVRDDRFRPACSLTRCLFST